MIEILKDGKVLCRIIDKSLIYSDKILSSMKSANYTFKINGKTAGINSVKSLRNGSC